MYTLLRYACSKCDSNHRETRGLAAVGCTLGHPHSRGGPVSGPGPAWPPFLAINKVQQVSETILINCGFYFLFRCQGSGLCCLLLLILIFILGTSTTTGTLRARPDPQPGRWPLIIIYTNMSNYNKRLVICSQSIQPNYGTLQGWSHLTCTNKKQTKRK